MIRGGLSNHNNGNITMEMNTSGMNRAYMNQEGKLEVKIYKDE